MHTGSFQEHIQETWLKKYIIFQFSIYFTVRVNAIIGVL